MSLFSIASFLALITVTIAISSSLSSISFSSSSAISKTNTLCSLPTFCTSKNQTLANQFRPAYKIYGQNVNQKFLHRNSRELCNIEHFCATNPPGSYCYVPTADILQSNCSCSPIAYVDCPFGIINLCQRGFVCADAYNDSGIKTATCQRIATMTTIGVATSVTETVTSRFHTVLPTSIVKVHSIRPLHSDSPIRFVSYTSFQLIATSVTSMQQRVTEISSTVTTSLPYTVPAPLTLIIATTSCNGTKQGNTTTQYYNPSTYVTSALSNLCNGPFPINNYYYTATRNVIYDCRPSVTVSVSTAAGSTSLSISVTTSLSSSSVVTSAQIYSSRSSYY